MGLHEGEELQGNIGEFVDSENKEMIVKNESRRIDENEKKRHRSRWGKNDK